jgi:hypothetical protein
MRNHNGKVVRILLVFISTTTTLAKNDEREVELTLSTIEKSIDLLPRFLAATKIANRHTDPGIFFDRTAFFTIGKPLCDVQNARTGWALQFSRVMADIS